MSTAMQQLAQRRPLGKTGIEVSLLGCGTWGMCTESYGAIFPEQQKRALERALARGITTFDMAPVWGAEGASERAVAAAVGDKRAECVYVTRAGQLLTEHGFVPMFDAASLRAECEASLVRLATDRIDVWLLHGPSEADLKREDVARAAEQLVSDGKVRAWGVSVNDIDAARAALTRGAQVLCVPYHVLSTELFDDIADDCAARGVGLLVRSVLFHGLLSGVYSPGRRFPAADHRASRFSPEALSERLRQVATMRPLVLPPARSLAGLALHFATLPPAVGSALFGPRTAAHVDAAVDAFEAGGPALSDDTLRGLRAVR